ncbi:hypothetical protein BDZ97DRAFT_1816192 [Flammula alnicola]|nr:hypothetical protein BDZ97DRAFT_1816192 [Flammula alnicola]
MPSTHLLPTHPPVHYIAVFCDHCCCSIYSFIDNLVVLFCQSYWLILIRATCAAASFTSTQASDYQDAGRHAMSSDPRGSDPRPHLLTRSFVLCNVVRVYRKSHRTTVAACRRTSAVTFVFRKDPSYLPLFLSPMCARSTPPVNCGFTFTTAVDRWWQQPR